MPAYLQLSAQAIERLASNSGGVGSVLRGELEERSQVIKTLRVNVGLVVG
jgi:hypothetical protein